MVTKNLTTQTPTTDMPTTPDELDAKISRAVVDELGLDSVEELDETIYEAINPDALNNLFREDNWAQVTFDFNGCQVTVDSNGTIGIDA